VARALIIGCGCCGRALGERLHGEGWAVRGTSRREAGLAEIEAAGLEAAPADPERPGTVLELVGDVAVLVLALGSAGGDPEQVAAVHGPRLESLVERLVDTPVRGVVYEASGTVEPALFAGGAETLRRAERTWRIPVELVEASRDDHGGWVEAMAIGVARAISPAR
jgi:nucleoside-diphosphate-sugar epimerase